MKTNHSVPLALLVALLPTTTSLAQPVATSAAPQWLKPPITAERLAGAKFASKAAGTEVSYLIYTPAEYDAARERRYPVLYWLHGVGSGQDGVPAMVARFDAAIRAGKTPPMFVVFVNGLADSMWVDSQDGKVPMETIVIKELIPHIDATYRTLAAREGRLIEGFSMGGFGAARLGFKHHELFGGISILAGALHTETTFQEIRAAIFQRVFGGDAGYFRAQSPWQIAETHAAKAHATGTGVRQVVGDRDPTMSFNRNYDSLLTRLGVPHSYIVLPGIGHNPNQVYEALGEENWRFYREVFGARARTSSATQEQSVKPGINADYLASDMKVEFRRTRVIGFSQVGQARGGWFVADGVFESLAGDDRWELLWANGAGVDRWRDPAFEGWKRPLVSPCPGDTPVDRVLLSISGPYGSDENAWTEAIDTAVDTIKSQLPSLRQIVLQPVVGGPGGQSCPAPAGASARGDGRVRASWQHTHIVRAIHDVVKRRTGAPVSVIAGYQPTVRTCGDYADALGHLTSGGAAAAARAIGEYYAR